MVNQQFEWYPRVLIIGPGGIKGLKSLGFLVSLSDAGLLKYTDTYCGVSIGALISLLIVCGYEIRDIVDEFLTIDFIKDIDQMFTINKFGQHSNNEEKHSLSNEPIKRKLTQLVLNKLGSVPTLYSLYLKTGKSLVTVTLNATDTQCEIMDPFKYPDVSCIEATMFSMNVPFHFYHLIYQGKTYVDGSLANPYPVNYFDDNQTNILGIHMRYSEEKKKSETEEFKPHVIIQKLSQVNYIAQHLTAIELNRYFLKIISTIMDQRRNEIISLASNKCKHVCLETKIPDAINDGFNLEEKAEMLIEGFNEGKQFLHELNQKSEHNNPIVPIPLGKYNFPNYYFLDE